MLHHHTALVILLFVDSKKVVSHIESIQYAIVCLPFLSILCKSCGEATSRCQLVFELDRRGWDRFHLSQPVVKTRDLWTTSSCRARPLTGIGARWSLMWSKRASSA